MKNELKMETILRIVGIISMVLVIGFSMAACGDDDGGSDVYKLTWGVWTGTTYSYVASQFAAQDVVLKTPLEGSNAGYISGDDAENAASYIQTNYQFDDSGEKTGSFEDLLNYKKDGIGAPQELKTAMLAEKERNMSPIGGIFQASANSTIVVIAFYIEIIKKASSNGGGGGSSSAESSSSFTVNSTSGRLTINGFPSEYEGKYVYGTGYGLRAYEDITVNSKSSITIHYGTITDGSVTLKVWGGNEGYIYYPNFNDSGSYSVTLYDQLIKTKTLTGGGSAHEPNENLIVRDVDVNFTNGVGTVDVSSYFDE